MNLEAIASNGTLNWYATSTSVLSLGTGSPFTTPNLSGDTVYYVEADGGTCASTRVAVQVIIHAQPTITGTTPGARCGIGTVELLASGSSGTLSWYATSTSNAPIGTGSPFVTPTISTDSTYYVEVDDGICTSVNRIAVLATINSIPTVSSVLSGARCGEGTVALNATASAGVLNWYIDSLNNTPIGTGSLFTTPIVSASTSYYVGADDGICVSTERLKVDAIVHSIPLVNDLADVDTCGIYILPAITGNNLTGNQRYYTATNSSGISFNVGDTITNNVILYLFDSSATNPSCFSEETVNIIVNPLPVVPTISNTGGSCPGDTMTIKVAPYSNAVTVDWGPTSIVSTALVEDADSLVLINLSNDYILTARLTDAITGCSNLQDVSYTIAINAAPVIVDIIEPTGMVCPLTSAMNTYDLGAIVTNASTLQWSSRESKALFTSPTTDTTQVSFDAISDSVWIVLEANNSSCGSSVFDSVVVFVDTSYHVDFGMDGAVICLEDDVTYVVVNSGEEPIMDSLKYTWVLNNTDTISTSIAANVMDLKATDFLELFVLGDFCHSQSSIFYDSLSIPYVARPGGSLVINGDTEHHLEGVLSLNNNKIELSDFLTADVRLRNNLTTPVSWEFLWLDLTDSLIFDGEEGKIDSSIIRSYPALTTALVPNRNSHSYAVKYYMVTSNGVCRDTSTALLQVDYELFIPNVFTPNDDGFFDEWSVENALNYGQLDVQIFNRWGNLVFSDDDWDNQWAGNNNSGDRLPAGTYFYILETAVEGVPVFRGMVSILK